MIMTPALKETNKKHTQMHKKITLAVIIMGFSGFIAEIVLLRELLMAFQGNELSIGVILANWLLMESAGAHFLGRKISRAKRKLGLFILVTVLFTIFFLAAIYATRIFRDFLPLMPGEGVGILTMFAVSFVVLLPVSLLHGALFTSGCQLHFLYTSTRKRTGNLSAFSIARVYIYETLGTIAGGVILTFIFIPWLHAINIALSVAMINLVICIFLLQPIRKGSRQPVRLIPSLTLLLLLSGIIYLVAGSGAGRLHLSSLEKHWKNHHLLHHEQSQYGSITVTERGEEYTFYSDGTPILSSPNPDLVYVEEFVHFPMLFHPDPQKVAVLSGGAGGVINEILKHNVNRIDYAEVDPLLPEIVRKFPTPLTESELNDPRVHITGTDSRFFIKRTPHTYDVILSGFSDPSTLQTNRFFTREFFSLAKSKLNPGGILKLGVPGSLTYLGRELTDLNAIVLNTLKSVFPHVRVIPGENKNFFLASSYPAIKTAQASDLAEEIRKRELELLLMGHGHINYKLDSQWKDFFYAHMEEGSEEINEDFKPLAVFYSLVFWNEQFSPAFNNYFRQSKAVSLPIIAGVLLGVFLLFLLFSSGFRQPMQPALALVIFSTGFAGMLFDLILIFAFQVLYGYIFYWLGLLITAFMAGVMAGGLWMSSLLKKTSSATPAIIRLELLIIVFALLLPLVFMGAGDLLAHTWFDPLLKAVFLLLSFISGILVGSAFPLANREYLRTSRSLSGTAGFLYSSDLMGGWLGGIIGGVVLLPVMGLTDTSLVIVMFKALSLALLLLTLRKVRTIR